LLLASLPVTQAAAPPLTPGAVALLVKHSDADYRPTLRRAVSDADPVVRAVAARVIAVRRQGDMRDALQAASASETSTLAATEQKRALARLAQSVPANVDARAADDVEAVRTLPMIVPGILSSLMTAAGCKPGKYGLYGAARVTFDATGLPGHIAVDAAGLPPPCREVLETALLLTLAEDSELAPLQSSYFLLPLDAEFVRCSDTTPPPSSRLDGPISIPHKTRDVKPEYPQSAVDARVSGVVIAVATITTTGCVGRATVKKSVSTLLDFAALRAVMAWRFEPARIGGAPVPVIMTVTVNFQLR
jgi:TonB family protein